MDAYRMSEHLKIEPDSLADHLYSHYGIQDIERLVANGSFEPLCQQWSLSTEQCQQQIELAMHYIKHD